MCISRISSLCVCARVPFVLYTVCVYIYIYIVVSGAGGYVVASLWVLVEQLQGEVFVAIPAV